MWHYLMQIALLMTFAAVSASGESRRTGLILTGFAALYLGLMPLNGVMDGISPPLYALLYAVMDAVAARLLFIFGDRGSRPQIVLLYCFVCAHIMAWAYASGLPSILDPHRYVVLTMGLAVGQIIVAWPIIKDGVREIKGLVEEALADYRLQRQLSVVYHSGSDSDPLSVRPGSVDISGDGGCPDLRGVRQVDRPPGEIVQ